MEGMEFRGSRVQSRAAVLGYLAIFVLVGLIPLACNQQKSSKDGNIWINGKPVDGYFFFGATRVFFEPSPNSKDPLSYLVEKANGVFSLVSPDGTEVAVDTANINQETFAPAFPVLRGANQKFTRAFSLLPSSSAEPTYRSYITCASKVTEPVFRLVMAYSTETVAPTNQSFSLHLFDGTTNSISDAYAVHQEINEEILTWHFEKQGSTTRFVLYPTVGVQNFPGTGHLYNGNTLVRSLRCTIR